MSEIPQFRPRVDTHRSHLDWRLAVASAMLLLTASRPKDLDRAVINYTPLPIVQSDLNETTFFSTADGRPLTNDVMSLDSDIEKARAELAKISTNIGADEAHKLGITGKGVIIHEIDTGVEPGTETVLLGQRCVSDETNYEIGQVSSCQAGEGLENSARAAEYKKGSIDNVAHGEAQRQAINFLAIDGLVKPTLIGSWQDTNGKLKPVIKGKYFKDALRATLHDIQKQPNVRHVVELAGGGEHYYEGIGNDWEPEYAQIMHDLVEANAVVVVAAGNIGENGPVVTGEPRVVDTGSITNGDPVDDGILTVAAVNAAGTGLSTISAVTEHVLISSYGEHIPVIYPSGEVKRWTGTSSPTGHVAGAVALLLQADPDITSNHAEFVLNDSSEKIQVPLVATEGKPPIMHTVAKLNVAEAVKRVLREKVYRNLKSRIYLTRVGK